MADSGRPMPSSFDGDENVRNQDALSKIVRKIKEEPLVPLGAALTVYALVNAARSVRRGDSHAAQRFFRMRVLFQGLTVVAMVAGGLYYSEDRRKTSELHKLQTQQEAEEKRAKWIRELEARDEEEKSLKRRLEEKKRQHVEQMKREEEGLRKQEGGVLSKLGLWKSMGQEKVEAAKEKVEGGEGKGKRNPKSALGSLGEIVSEQSKPSSKS